MNKKAQIFSSDLILSAFVFTAVLSFVFIILVNNQIKIENNLKNSDLEAKVLQITDILIQSPGDPTNWEEDTSNVNVIGLADKDRTLSEDKLTEFLELDYNITREKMNIEGIDFYFVLKELNEGIVKINGNETKTGMSPSLNSTQIILVKRFVLYDEKERIVEFSLWK